MTLAPEDKKRLAGARPVNPEAYDAYLKGSFYWKTLTPQGLDTAESYFELALEKDPSYSPAHAGLAWVWADRQQMGIAHPRDAGPKGRAAAERAVELDEGSAGAHAALAAARTWTDWDWEGAEKAWRRALELDPRAANTHAYFAHFLAITGRIDEAIDHSERALELNPYNALFHALYGVMLDSDGRLDDAMAAYQTALSIHPSYPFVLNNLRSIYIARGMREELLADQRRRIARDPELVAAFEEGLVEGGPTSAYRRLADLLATRYEASNGVVPQGQRAMGVFQRYLAAGDHDRAIDWLEKAYEDEHSPAMPYLGIQTLYGPLRSDPRFQDLLRRMNLPQAKVGS